MFRQLKMLTVPISSGILTYWGDDVSQQVRICFTIISHTQRIRLQNHGFRLQNCSVSPIYDKKYPFSLILYSHMLFSLRLYNYLRNFALANQNYPKQLKTL